MEHVNKLAQSEQALPILTLIKEQTCWAKAILLRLSWLTKEDSDTYRANTFTFTSGVLLHLD